MKISRQVAIFGVILPFYIGQKWVKIFTNRSGQAGGGVNPRRPPKAVSLTAFPQVFFDAFPYRICGFCGKAWGGWQAGPYTGEDAANQPGATQPLDDDDWTFLTLSIL